VTDRPQQTPIVGYPVRTRTPYLIRRGISTVETAVYLVVGLLLILAAVLTVVGTLAVSLATAIFLLRRSAGGSESLGAGMEERGTARRVDYSD